MKILLVGTSTNASSHLAGFNHGYGHGFSRLGHNVDSVPHAFAGSLQETGYDFFLLRDTTISPDVVLDLKRRAYHFAIFTHSEWHQRKKDRAFIEKVQPGFIFLDQQLGGQAFDGLGIPMEWLGYGANPLCRRVPWNEKDIDVLWVGHGYAERQGRVEKYIWPIKDSGLNVKIHGAGQPDGPLGLEDMFEVMSRSKIVVQLVSSFAQHWGYGGRRIYDALASGAVVVSDIFPECRESYPCGVFFTGTEEVGNLATGLFDSLTAGEIEEIAGMGYEWVKNGHMIQHVCQKMLERVGL